MTFQPMQTSDLIAAGHSLRIEVSSSNFPRYDRNLNTGGNNYDEVRTVVAHNQVHHSTAEPSSIMVTALSASASSRMNAGMKTIVQISLDFTSIPKALETARLAVRAGVDWLEAGTPLIVSEGMNSIRALRAEFPGVPIVADLKAMDGGWLEAQVAASAGATHVVVMERAHPETIKAMVQAAKDLGVKVMGDNLAAEDRVAAAKRLEDFGCDFVIHHIGYDERRGLAAIGKAISQSARSTTRGRCGGGGASPGGWRAFG